MLNVHQLALMLNVRQLLVLVLLRAERSCAREGSAMLRSVEGGCGACCHAGFVMRGFACHTWRHLGVALLMRLLLALGRELNVQL